MLAQGTVFATMAVHNLAAAKDFYGGKLGLKQIDENPDGVSYESGDGRLFVYQAATAGTNQATSAAWEVADVYATVADLKEKGIIFERYDVPGAVWDGDVMQMGAMKVAWFKDPDGNTLSVGSVA